MSDRPHRSLKQDLFEIGSKAIELPYKKIGYSCVCGSKKHLPVTEQCQIPQHIKKREKIDIINMSNWIIEKNPWCTSNNTTIQAEKY